MRLPYFALLIENRKHDAQASRVFSGFVHWGLWQRWWAARTDGESMQEAMVRMNDAVVAGARITEKMAVLDVGCGFGGTLKRLTESVPELRTVGLNIDHSQLSHAVVDKSGLICADACRLPFADDSFDAGLAVECIFHFPSRLQFLKEAERVLRPGAYLSMSDFVPLRPWVQNGAFGRWATRQISRGFGVLKDWPDGDYAALAKASGLELVEIRDVTRNTLPTYLALMRLALRGGFGPGQGVLWWPAFVLGTGGVLGLIRYQLIVVRKPESASPPEK